MDHFLPDELLFELPVYRVSVERFGQELRDTVEDAFASMANAPAWKGTPPDLLHEEAERWARMRFGRPYWYNEMIGVIRLYQDGGSVKGEFWGQPQRSFRRNFQHYRYDHHGRVIEYHAPPGPLSSGDIYDKLHELLQSCASRGGGLQGRHIDLTAFERVGPHIDWLKVLGWRKHDGRRW